MKKIFLLGLMLIFNSVPVFANLITMDWKVANDGLILRETNSNLEWLNLTQSYGLSYNQVFAMTDDPEDLFEGWHIARESEMISLFNAVGGDGHYCIDGPIHGAGNSVDLLMQYWGISSQEGRGTYVIYDSLTWFQTELLVKMARLENNPYYDEDDEGVLWPAPDDIEMDSECLVDLHISMAQIAVALVRAAPANPVPEPVALLLMGPGLAGLIGTCRKKKA